MADLSRFREKLTEYRQLVGRTQTELAIYINLDSTELSNRLRGNKKAKLTFDNARAIIRALADWGAIRTQAQARELCQMLDCPDFDGVDWAAPPLNKLNATPIFAPVEEAANLETEKPAHNLPLYLPSFIGREEKLTELLPLLEPQNSNCRLLTLVGMGGTGKTRLALELFGKIVNRFRGGVWLVELAAISTPALLAETVAKVLGVKEQVGEETRQSLVRFLKTRQIMLVLDNCEHLLVECARLTEFLLQNCPTLKILTTSREPMAIRGEIVRRVPSLKLPETDLANLENLGQSEAVKLFVARAQEIQPDFELTSQNAPILAKICRQLDGIPLAIELAAARIQSISLEQIEARLHRRFQLLTGGSTTALPRQKTLRGLLDWSYDLLSPPQQILFERLSVFAGSWSLEAAISISGNSYEADEFGVLDGLSQLVNKSLVIAEPHNGEMRYQMLETLRQYGQEKLYERGEIEAVYLRHSRYFLELALKAEPELLGADQAAWLSRLEQEHPNVRTALLWLLKDPAHAEYSGLALELAGALWRFWWLRGYLREGRRWLEQVLAATNAQNSAARAKALKALGTLCNEQTDYSAAQRYYEESLAIFRELDDRPGIASLVSNLGVVAYDQGDYQNARTLYTEGLGIFRELGNLWAVSSALNNLGLVARDLGDYAAARQMLEESFALKRDLNDQSGQVNTLSSLGDLLLDVGDYATARQVLRQSLLLNRDLNDPVALAHLLEYTASLLALEKTNFNLPLALQLAGASQILREQVGVQLSAKEQKLFSERLQSTWNALDDADNVAWNTGRQLSAETATELALTALD